MSDVQWYGAAYTLPFAVLLITGGRLGDIAGRRRIFRIGVAGFVLASLVCAAAPSAGALIAARAVQGAAAALVVPQTVGLIRAMYDGDGLARAMGSIGPVMGLAAVCGPVLGGVLTHAGSWRAAFLVNVPLGLAVLAAARFLPEDRSAARPRLDLTGTALVSAAVGLLTYPLITSGSWPWLAPSAVLFGAFVLHQRSRARRSRSPLVEPSLLLGNRGFPAALVCSLLFFATVNGLLLVVVLQLQLGAHIGVLAAGLSLVPWSAAMAVSSLVAGGRLVPRYGARVMYAGLGTLGVGAAAAIAAYANSPASGARYSWPLLIALAVCGVGQGLFVVPFFTAALHRVRPHETGSASGLLNAVQQLGGTLGVALLGGVFLRAGTVLGGAEAAFGAALGLLVVTGVAAARLVSSTGTSTGTGTRPAA